MIDKLFRLGQMLLEPGSGRAILHWKPFSISSFRMVSTLRQKGLDFRTIIDGGANVGQFARASTELYPEAKVYSIEPLPEVAETFRVNFADRPQVELIESALGSWDGTATIHVSPYSQISSLLPMKNGHHARQVGNGPPSSIEVRVARLDTLLAGKALERPVLLKLDLQGFELEALKGAPETLALCDHVLCETVFEEVYVREPLFEDLLAFLQGEGFRFLQPLAFLKNADGGIFQMDALFQKISDARPGSRTGDASSNPLC